MTVEVWGALALTDNRPVASVDADVVLARVFRADGPALVGLARLLLDDPRQAEEVVQEAFIRTYTGWSRVRNREEPLPYVRRAVVNLARSGLRRRRTERAFRIERPDDAPSAEDTAAAQARDDAVALAVAALPRRQRECVVLRFYVDCTVPDVAATLRISDGSVKQHLHRALATLGEQFREDDI